MVNLYLISRIGPVEWDEVAGYVIAAEGVSSARDVPFTEWSARQAVVAKDEWQTMESESNYERKHCENECRHPTASEMEMGDPPRPCVWRDPTKTTCALIGVATGHATRGVVLRSFNAG